MPTRTRVRDAGTSLIAGRGGFGGFAPNPSIPYPGGSVLTSDVQQATDALNFGGGSSITSTPTVTPPPSPPPVVIDPSGAGYVSSGLTGNTLRSLPNDRFVSNSDKTPSIPSSGGRSPMFTSDPNADWLGTTETFASSGGQSPSLISDPNEDWTGVENPGGEPTVDVARQDAAPSESGMEDEPVLFQDPTTAQQTPSVSITPTSGRGGFSAAGHDIAQFGEGMTIGQFLNTPLAMLSFGRGYEQSMPRVGSGTVDYANTSYTTPELNAAAPGASDLGTVSPEAEAQGALDTAEAKASGEINPDGTTGQTTQVAGQSPTGTTSLGAILQTYPSLNNPAAIRAIQGGANPASLMGHAQFDSHAGNLLLMESQAFGGTPNSMRGTPEEGRNRFDPSTGYIGRIDPDTGILGRVKSSYDSSKVFRMGQKKDAPVPYGVVGEIAYNNWLRQQPEYKKWLKTKKNG